jgi:hypothetical protein
MSQLNLITWTKTNCMKDMFVYDGYMYQFCKPNIGDDYYRCCMSRAVTVANKCKSSINLSKDRTLVTKQPTPHNHPKPIPAAPIVKRLRNNTKVRMMKEPKNKPLFCLKKLVSLVEMKV